MSFPNIADSLETAIFRLSNFWKLFLPGSYCYLVLSGYLAFILWFPQGENSLYYMVSLLAGKRKQILYSDCLAERASETYLAFSGFSLLIPQEKRISIKDLSHRQDKFFLRNQYWKFWEGKIGFTFPTARLDNQNTGVASSRMVRYYPGCQRLFMRGFRFRSLWWPASPLVTFEAFTEASSRTRERKNLWYPG